MQKGIIWMIPILGMPLIGWLVGGLAVSMFSWFALQVIVPLVLLLGMFGTGVFIIYYGIKRKETIKIGQSKVPISLPMLAVGIIFIFTAMFMFKPTAGYTLAFGQTFALGEEIATVEQAQGLGVFDTNQLLSFVNTDEESTLWMTPQWLQVFLTGATLWVVSLTYKNRKKWRRS